MSRTSAQAPRSASSGHTGCMQVSDRVRAAMAATPRAAHLPDSQRHLASLDMALPLFRGATNSQPSTVARMLDSLDVPIGGRVLDVGAGSGWTTALLAWLVGPTGSVLGLEIDGEVAAWGAERLGHTGRVWARLEVADPTVLGCPGEAPFDRILVSAMASHLPEQLTAQLSDEGVLVIPVDGQLWTVRRSGSGLDVTRSGAYVFVPLIEPGDPTGAVREQ